MNDIGYILIIIPDTINSLSNAPKSLAEDRRNNY